MKLLATVPAIAALLMSSITMAVETKAVETKEEFVPGILRPLSPKANEKSMSPAKSESIWLVLSRFNGGFEKIEMIDKEQCQEMRDYWWENSEKLAGSYSICITGK